MYNIYIYIYTYRYVYIMVCKLYAACADDVHDKPKGDFHFAAAEKFNRLLMGAVTLVWSFGFTEDPPNI